MDFPAAIIVDPLGWLLHLSANLAAAIYLASVMLGALTSIRRVHKASIGVVIVLCAAGYVLWRLSVGEQASTAGSLVALILFAYAITSYHWANHSTLEESRDTASFESRANQARERDHFMAGANPRVQWAHWNVLRPV